MGHGKLRGIRKVGLSKGFKKKNRKSKVFKKDKAKKISDPQSAVNAEGACDPSAPPLVAVAAGAASTSTPQQVEAPKVSKKTKAEMRALAAVEDQHRSLYAPGEQTLLVGEGNFSFARALCRHLGEGANIFATAFDDEATLRKKYPDVAACRKEVEDKFGATTLVGVDATRLHKVKEFKGAFRKIVFNFPHLGSGEADVEKSIASHRKLLHDFLQSAVQCLAEDKGAAIHVALKTGEPYKSWKIAQTLRLACPDLDLLTAVPFANSAWEGYAHRRTHGFDERLSKADSEEIAKGAKVYVIGRTRKKRAVSSPTIKLGVSLSGQTKKSR